jgi:hypothetical protein
MAFLGYCGFGRPSPCRLAWTSSFRPYQVGIYPSEYLPANLTIWYASAFFVGSFQPPIISPGDFGGIGFGILGGLVATGAFSFQTDIWNTPSWYSLIWAKTTTHINYEYTLTAQDLLNTVQNEAGKIRVKLSDYVFDVLCVIDDPKPIADEVSRLKEEIYNSTEPVTDEYLRSKDDQFTHAVFSIEIPSTVNNRFDRIYPNLMGLEYRLDNLRAYAAQISNFRQSEMLSPTYNDASSKEIVIRLGDYVDPVTGKARPMKAGDKIYITYLGVPAGGHIMRQHIFVRWSGYATSLPTVEAGCMTPSIEAAHYRFFTWDLEKKNPNDPQEEKKQVSGWRVVETYSYNTNFIEVAETSNSKGQLTQRAIADFARGNQTGHIGLKVLDGTVSYERLQAFLAGSSQERTIYGDFNKPYEGGQYHLNASKFDVSAADWVKGYSPSSYSYDVSHLVYNVHPKALRRRDIDKWGIPRFMADEIQKSISAGKTTYVPFMDDPYNTDPLNQVGHLNENGQITDKYLDANNFLIKPIQRYGRYGGNADCRSGSMGGIGVGNWGADNYAASLLFTSNIITEFMPKGTKILIEQFFTSGARGPEILAISARVGATVQGLSCILDPSRSYVFIIHQRGDYLAFSRLETGYLNKGMQSLTYRPEILMKTNAEHPKMTHYEKEVGYSGLLGDRPGFSHGNLVNVAFYGDKDSFEYYSSSPQESIYKSEPSKMTKVTYTATDDTITLSLPKKYYGFTTLRYRFDCDGTCDACDEPCKKAEEQECQDCKDKCNACTEGLRQDDEAMIIFRMGDSIVNVIDSLSLREEEQGQDAILFVEHPWIEADKIEIVCNRIRGLRGKPLKIDLQALVDARAKDFLDGRTSDTPLATSDPQKLDKNPVLIASPIASVAEDTRSVLYVFFQDKRDGISVAISRNFGDSWSYQYGIIEKIASNAIQNPFVLSHPKTDRVYLFFMMREKIFCKPIDLRLFNEKDEMRVVSYASDVLKVQQSETKESAGWFTSEGRTLRGHTPAYLAAGSRFDSEYLDMMKVKPVTIEENRNGTMVTTVQEQKAQSMEIGVNTCFVYKPVEDAYCSAYRRDQGEMLLFFLGKIANGKNRLQCHYSTDDGISWFDTFERMNKDTARVKIDSDDKFLFIDRDNKYANKAEGDGPTASEASYIYGINLHKQGKSKDDEEEDISSPYVFHQPSAETVFVFYVYKNALFCKTFPDSLFRGTYDSFKEIVEGTKSVFVDGWVKGTAIAEEVNEVFTFQWATIEAAQTTNPDVTFPHKAVDTFDENRSVDPQRVAACEIDNGLIKVFYKTKGGVLRSATYKEPYWVVDDLLRKPESG